MAFHSLINPAGGLYYHITAWRYRHKLWHPFVADLSNFFNDWQPPEKQLVIIGGSGGYCLPSSLLKNYKAITLIDPDPLAPLAFARRHKRKLTKIDRHNYFKSPKDLRLLFGKYSNSAFLFSNIIGQLPLLAKNHALASAQGLNTFRDLLSECRWASFHDALSFRLPAQSEGLLKQLSLEVSQKSELVENLCQLLKLGGWNSTITLNDHETDKIFCENLPKNYYLWQIKPHTYHIIEAVSQSC